MARELLARPRQQGLLEGDLVIASYADELRAHRRLRHKRRDWQAALDDLDGQIASLGVDIAWAAVTGDDVLMRGLARERLGLRVRRGHVKARLAEREVT